MNPRFLLGVLLQTVWATVACADGLLYTYDGNVPPYHPSAGWIVGNPCEPPCSESIEDGAFVLHWPTMADDAYYLYRFATPGQEPPATFWAEWRFASNHPLGPNFFACDAWFQVDYKQVDEDVSIYGDSIISFGGNFFVLDLPLNEYRTYRFESSDGFHFRFSIDGFVFWVGNSSHKDDGWNKVAFYGRGGCGNEQPDVINRWDYVRFGALSSGEPIISTEPPRGYLDPVQFAGTDRFVVTFSQPNYVYIDDIEVSVSSGDTPQVIATRRRANDGPQTVEIVLDRPMTVGETTTFTFNDGSLVQTVSYTLAVQVPAASGWGLAVFSLLLLVAASVLFRLPAERTWRRLPLSGCWHGAERIR